MMEKQKQDNQARPGRGWRAGGRLWRRGALLALLPLVLLAAGCGTSALSPLPVATDTAPAATPAVTAPPAAPPAPPTAPPTATAAPAAAVTATSPAPAAATGGPAVTPAYAHRPDYAMIAGQVHHQVACWVVTYVSPLVDSAPDQYHNQLSLIAGSAWDAATLKDGAWVIVTGHPDPSSPQSQSMSCGVTGYAVTALQVDPNAP